MLQRPPRRSRNRPASPTEPGASPLPQGENLRAASATVATAVALRAERDGVAGRRLEDTIQEVQDAMWQPEYT